MSTLKAIYENIKKRLTQADIDYPDKEARLLIRGSADISDADLIARSEITIKRNSIERIESMLARRLAGEPLSRIFGEREFWGLPFTVTPDVLDPRPDTETVVEAALKAFPEPPGRILDLGTGSGCLIVALLHEWPEARGVAVDLSAAALAVARGNAERNGVGGRVEFYQGSWFEALPHHRHPGEGRDPSSGRVQTGDFRANVAMGPGLRRDDEYKKFDLIVSNPPYIPNPVIPTLDKEVRNHDPILALSGGIDGFDSYRIIFSGLDMHFSDKGIGLFEIGIGQGSEAMRLAEDSGLRVKRIHPDLAGIPRVVEISRGDK